MTGPTLDEMRAFIEKLRVQASFLGDPALTSAADFVEEIYTAARFEDFAQLDSYADPAPLTCPA